MNADVLKYYKQARKPYAGPNYFVQAPAHGALNVARMKAWVGENWGDNDYGPNPEDVHSYSNDGLWRVRVVPDEFCTIDDMLGDTYDPKHALPIHGGVRALEAQKKEYIAKLERDGIFGIVLEKRVNPCPTCGKGAGWEQVDSCWGFDYSALDDAIVEFQYRIKDGAA